jgi:flavin reductase (DIM6/NTAB) family NADH-FMN oxidoreductase RutF
MHLTNSEIQSLNKIRRLNIINSITGIKPANLLGTISEEGGPNLAIISSAVHIGSNPPFIAFILRPGGEASRHTYRNIKENGIYTINHVHQSFIEKAHYTSAKFPFGVSEFEKVQLSEEYLEGFKAPFVKESQIKVGMNFRKEVPIKLNDTLMIIGEVMHVFVPDDLLSDEGYIDLERSGSAGISGLNSYYDFEKIGEFPYARVEEVPHFDMEK